MQRKKFEYRILMQLAIHIVGHSPSKVQGIVNRLYIFCTASLIDDSIIVFKFLSQTKQKFIITMFDLYVAQVSGYTCGGGMCFCFIINIVICTLIAIGKLISIFKVSLMPYIHILYIIHIIHYFECKDTGHN